MRQHGQDNKLTMWCKMMLHLKNSTGSLIESTKLVALTPLNLDELYHVFKRNLDRLDDIVIDIMVEDIDDFRSAYLATLNADPQTLFPFLIRYRGQTIGTVEVSHERSGAVRLGYLIDAEYEGRGIITHHLLKLIQQTDKPVEARIHENNARSMAVAERLGLVRDEESLNLEHYIWRSNS